MAVHWVSRGPRVCTFLKCTIKNLCPRPLGGEGGTQPALSPAGAGRVRGSMVCGPWTHAIILENRPCTHDCSQWTFEKESGSKRPIGGQQGRVTM